MKIEPQQIEEAARELYIRALKLLPPDIKQGFTGLVAKETDATAQGVLGTMIRNITVAEDTDNLLCQDTGIPDLQRAHRAQRRTRRLRPEAGDPHRLRTCNARAPAALARWCIRSRARTSTLPADRHVPVINIDFTSDG